MPARGVITNKRPIFCLLIMLVFLSSYLLPVFLTNRPVGAAGTLKSRKITLGSSVPSTANTYSVSFTPATSTSIKAIVVDFCSAAGGGPLIGTQCSSANHPVTGIQTSGTVVVTQTSGFGTQNFTAVAPNANIGSGKALVIQLSAGTSGTSTSIPVTFSFTATNPPNTLCSGNNNCTFYARILTFSTTADSTTYDSTSSGSANPGNNVIDNGGIALSTANQITVSARVQEVLQFCVGTTDVDNATSVVANDCSGTFANNCGTAVNLGVLDGSVVSESPVQVAAGTPGYGNNCNGAAMVRTNAGSGVSISYFPELESSSGKLKVIGATCSGSSVTDQCFNDSATQTVFTAGVENFGMEVAGTNCSATTTVSYSCSMASGTNQLKAVSPYIGGTGGTPLQSYGTSGSNAGYAWNDTGSTSPTQIASSTGPVEDETLILKFAATPSITTPTGSYTLTSTYVATATF